MSTIYTRIEAARGCGYRKPGGIYLVSDGVSKICCRLPHPLIVCPCCGQGIKQTRGFSWVSGEILGETKFPELCTDCILAHPTKMNFGLMWIGEKFYKTPDEFTREAITRGVSKRIAAVPHKLKIGETWVLLAHPKAIVKIDHAADLVNNDRITYTPGIFKAFKPTRIEYIVTGGESADELNDLERRGFTLINVVRDIDAQKSIL